MQSVDGPGENDRLARYAERGRHGRRRGRLAAAGGPARRAAGWERDRDARVVGRADLVGRDPMEWLREPAVLALFPSWPAGPGLGRRAGDRRAGGRGDGARPRRAGAASSSWTTWPARRWTPRAGSRGPTSSPARPLPGVAVKVSVGVDALTAWSAWRPEVLHRYVAHVLEHLGPERTMLASNWPVVLLRAPYGQAWTDLGDAARRRRGDGTELDEVRGGTAERWYGLGGRR